MGREIRRVPPDWEHPKFENVFGKLVHTPLYDQSYQEATAEWLSELAKWLEKYPSGLDLDGAAFWDDYGMPPDEDQCRPHWTPEEATAYQIYETISEGTPVSPVFQTLDEMHAWLRSEWGLTEKAASHFMLTGWSPSGLISSAGITKPGAETIEAWAKLRTDESEATE